MESNINFLKTLLNTYCEVEFLCKENSPNWLGFFLILITIIILYLLDDSANSRNLMTVTVGLVLFFLIISLILGWLL